MKYCINAEEQLKGARILAAYKEYRISVTLLCFSCELILKSLVELKDPMNPLLNSHDIVNLGTFIKELVNYGKISPNLALIAKLFNDSLYPYDASIYTKELYEECLPAVLNIRKEIGSACTRNALAESLSEKLGIDTPNRKN